MIPLKKMITPFSLFVGFFLISSISFGQNLAERLGYPANAKLLIIHADDIGVTHSENAATIQAYERGPLNSGSIMVPTHWFPEIAAYTRENPGFDLGLHLTLTSEWKYLQWDGVLPSNEIPSLIDKEGYFYETVEEFAEHAQPEEVEKELRAQIARALAFGIHPTHLDSHMGSLFSRPDLFEIYLKLGKEYGIPVLVGMNWLKGGPPSETRTEILKMTEDYPAIVQNVVMLNPSVSPEQWDEAYDKAIANLEPGLNELIVHVAYDNEEMRATTVSKEHWYESAWRQRDYDYVTSRRFRDVLRENNIKLVTWREIQNLIYPTTSNNPDKTRTIVSGNKVQNTGNSNISGKRPKILVFSKTEGYRHASIPAGVKALQALGEKHGLQIVHTEDAALFESDELSTCDALVFLNSTGNLFNENQQNHLKNYLKNGGGIIGIHAAADAEYDWPWYGKMMGAWFKSHPEIQQATVIVLDSTHISTRFLPRSWLRTDEWYNFKSVSKDINILLNLDESSYEGGTHVDNPSEAWDHAVKQLQKTLNKKSDIHPIAWYHEFGGGRVFYTGGGHTEESYSEPLFIKHIWGGIQYVLGSSTSRVDTGQ